MEDHFYYLCYLDHQLKLRPGKTYTIGRLDCEITIPSYLVSRRHARIEWQDGRPCLVDLGSTNGTKVNSEKVSKATLSPGDRIEVGNSILKLLRVTENNGAQTMKLSDTVMLEARVATLLHDIKDPELVNKITDLKSLFNKKNQALTKIAYRDSLTKLYNRRYFDSTLFEEVERAKRYHRPLQLILVDIDHFKRINDAHGHQKGDEVLTAIAQLIEQHSRSNDTVCRYGGEEIAIILPECSMNEARQVAEKIRHTIHTLSPKLTGLEVTASFGISGFDQQTDTPTLMLTAADRALYHAKQTGRNKVSVDAPLDTLA